MKSWSVMATGLLLLAGCCEMKDGNRNEKTNAGSTAVEKADGVAAGVVVIRVETPEQFINAIGSDRIIEVAADELALSKVKDRYMEHVRWDGTTAGNTVTIRRVKNLKIQAAGDKPVRLITWWYSAFVLNFEDVENVTLSHLIMGHAPDKGGCESGVVGIMQSSNITFDRCDLFGCGTEGLTISKSHDIRFSHSIIRECSYGIMTIESTQNLIFDHARFVENEKYYGGVFHDVKDVLFDNCIFEKNIAENDPLLKATSCSNIVLANCRFTDNKTPAQTNKSEAFIIKNTADEK